MCTFVYVFIWDILSLTVKSKNDVAEAIVLDVCVLVEQLIIICGIGVDDNEDEVEVEVAKLAMVLFLAGYL